MTPLPLTYVPYLPFSQEKPFIIYMEKAFSIHLSNCFSCLLWFIKHLQCFSFSLLHYHNRMVAALWKGQFPLYSQGEVTEHCNTKTFECLTSLFTVSWVWPYFGHLISRWHYCLGLADCVGPQSEGWSPQQAHRKYNLGHVTPACVMAIASTCLQGTLPCLWLPQPYCPCDKDSWQYELSRFRLIWFQRHDWLWALKLIIMPDFLAVCSTNHIKIFQTDFQSSVLGRHLK